ncbi:TerB family tellurite resistance protein [Pseudomonas sp. RTC3]|uniref:tellurite resistance TerB family protein n=1 Tax=Pseudomonas sp. 5C2 TaxID=3048588 RepID=UPI002AB5B50B|nr:TerB family tellurite resistance protein [Pseudomonas sp. 5C2]MDY7565818.1 TerB family tellurite resistance protein [Pseudomonas sp. 5C2]MEB0062487.1 TerB family tellurite resistance protein [Pseudomonas sp. RTC3]MEB0240492.1 TerB family tellurite resistance protein [Pseudomonas sp. 5C2]
MLGKLFGKKTGQARAAVAKLANRDLMEAVVYGAIYVAAADGDLEESELSKVETILSNNPSLQGFGAELSNTIDRAKTDFKSGARILRQNAEKELGDLAHSPAEALTVLNIMLTVAEADGEIEPAEMVALERSAKLLGLNLKDHL